MGRMGLLKAVQLKNGAVILTFEHGGGGRSLATVTAGGLLSVHQAAMLAGTYYLRAWRAASWMRQASQ